MSSFCQTCGNPYSGSPTICAVCAQPVQGQQSIVLSVIASTMASAISAQAAQVTTLVPRQRATPALDAEATFWLNLPAHPFEWLCGRITTESPYVDLDLAVHFGPWVSNTSGTTISKRTCMLRRRDDGSFCITPLPEATTDIQYFAPGSAIPTSLVAGVEQELSLGSMLSIGKGALTVLLECR